MPRRSLRLDRESNAAAVALTGESLLRFGEVRIRINGSSMLPAILPGDVVTVRRCEWPQISTGDIILFARESRLFLHRVVEEEFSACGSRALITRGDSLPNPDPVVTSGEYLGRLAAIRRGRRTLVPRPALSASQRMLASALCRFDWLAGGLLRLYSLQMHLAGPELP